MRTIIFKNGHQNGRSYGIRFTQMDWESLDFKNDVTHCEIGEIQNHLLVDQDELQHGNTYL